MEPKEQIQNKKIRLSHCICGDDETDSLVRNLKQILIMITNLYKEKHFDELEKYCKENHNMIQFLTTFIQNKNVNIYVETEKFEQVVKPYIVNHS